MPPATDEPAFAAEQRLAFGSVAEAYDRARPGYPEGAVDAVLEQGDLRRGDEVVEIGAGTGKLTASLAARGLRVLAVEPSAAMAAVGRRNCAGDVSFVEAEFESWVPPRRFAAVICANAWHWIDAGSRYRLAHAALAPAATLACLWTLPDWSTCTLRDELLAVYRRHVPELAPRFPMHPGSDPEVLAGDWSAEIAASGGRFADPRTIWFRWSMRFSARAYLAVLGTHQDHILLAPGRRDALLGAIAQAIEGAGGALELPTSTRVCLAARAG